jgi:hypothetical protein
MFEMKKQFPLHKGMVQNKDDLLCFFRLFPREGDMENTGCGNTQNGDA